MTCLLTLCLYITGGLGIQSGFSIDHSGIIATREPTNAYGLGIGELAVHIEREHIYMEFKHLSGINTAEGDWGLNAWMTGIIFRHKNLSLRGGVGPQTSLSTHHSNNYGNMVYEVSAMAEYDGLFVKAAKLSGIEQVSVGFVKHF